MLEPFDISSATAIAWGRPVLHPLTTLCCYGAGWVPPTVPEAREPSGRPPLEARAAAGPQVTPPAATSAAVPRESAAPEAKQGRAVGAPGSAQGLGSGSEPAGAQAQLPSLLGYSDSDGESASDDSGGGASGARPKFESFF